MYTNRSECTYGSGRSSTLSITVKIAVFAPTPSASVRIASRAMPGVLRSCRIANRKSYRKFCIESLRNRHFSRGIEKEPIARIWARNSLDSMYGISEDPFRIFPARFSVARGLFEFRADAVQLHHAPLQAVEEEINDWRGEQRKSLRN